MKLVIDDPLNAIGRVLDIARRLDLEVDHLKMSRCSGGLALLSVALADPECPAASRFQARIQVLAELMPETPHV